MSRLFAADTHRGDGKRFVVHADEKLTAFLELESAIRAPAWENPEQMSPLGAKYGLNFDCESVSKLCERFGLTMSRIAN